MECKECNDTGWIIVEKDGQEFARRCVCQVSDIQIHKLLSARIPKRFSGANLNNFFDTKDELKKAKTKVKNFIELFPSNSKGLLLSGPTGVGKTRLLSTIGNEIIQKGFDDVFFLDWNELINAIRQAASNSFQEEDPFSLESLREQAWSTNLLLFDEFFSLPLSETAWIREQIVENVNLIINRRYNDLKLTVLATNLPFKSRRPEEQSLPEVIGVRLFSRISEMTEFIEIKSNDQRKEYG